MQKWEVQTNDGDTFSGSHISLKGQFLIVEHHERVHIFKTRLWGLLKDKSWYEDNIVIDVLIPITSIKLVERTGIPEAEAEEVR